MTPGARRVLKELATDEECDLAQEGGMVFCGNRQTTTRVVNELLWLLAINISYRDGLPVPYTVYRINGVGMSLLRRPELEAEISAAIAHRKKFTLRDDRLVELTD